MGEGWPKSSSGLKSAGSDMIVVFVGQSETTLVLISTSAFGK